MVWLCATLEKCCQDSEVCGSSFHHVVIFRTRTDFPLSTSSIVSPTSRSSTRFWRRKPLSRISSGASGSPRSQWCTAPQRQSIGAPVLTR